MDSSTYWFVFFFQAEDGIRDLVRSRGLGDVYKRQEEKDRDFSEFFISPDALTNLKAVHPGHHYI